MPEPLPEHVVDRMAKELANYLAPLYPCLSPQELEDMAREMLRREPISAQWPIPTQDPPDRTYLVVTVGWYDPSLKLAHIGGCAHRGPTWWTEERIAEPLKPESERGPFDW
jgi:hypothetical protein